MKKIWPFTFYFWQYAAVACSAPFLVLFYQHLGFNGSQIGILTGLGPLITLFAAPMWTSFADSTRSHRIIMSLTLAGGAIAIFACPFFKGFPSVLLIVVAFSLFLAPISSFADSATMRMLGSEKSMYGRMRLGGTFGYAIAAPIAGQLVQRLGIQMAFYTTAVLYLLCFITGQMFEQPTAPGHSGRSMANARRALMGNPHWLLFLTAGLSGGIAIAVSNSYFFPYMKELGANETTMGLALTIGTICEVPVLFFGNRLLKAIGAFPLMIASLVITGIRLVLFSMAGSPTQALLIQLLNGFTFPAMWMAGVAYADAHAPAGMNASAQGILGAVIFGIGTAIGGFLGGALLGSMGARGMMLVFGLITFAILSLVLVVRQLLPAEALPTTN